METTRHAHDRMSSTVGEKLVAPDEQVETGHRVVHLLHDARAEAVRLYKLDSRSEVRAADLNRSGAFFRSLFNGCEQSFPCNVIEEGGGFDIADEIDGRDRDVRQIERHKIDAH